jgi:hypothetical protein
MRKPSKVGLDPRHLVGKRLDLGVLALALVELTDGGVELIDVLLHGQPLQASHDALIVGVGHRPDHLPGEAIGLLGVLRLDQEHLVAEVVTIRAAVAGQDHFSGRMQLNILHLIDVSAGGGIGTVAQDVGFEDVGGDALQARFFLGKHRKADERKGRPHHHPDDAPLPAFEIFDPHRLNVPSCRVNRLLLDTAREVGG